MYIVHPNYLYLFIYLFNQCFRAKKTNEQMFVENNGWGRRRRREKREREGERSEEII